MQSAENKLIQFKFYTVRKVRYYLLIHTTFNKESTTLWCFIYLDSSAVWITRSRSTPGKGVHQTKYY